MYTNQNLSHREHFLCGILVEPAAYEYSEKNLQSNLRAYNRKEEEYNLSTRQVHGFMNTISFGTVYLQ